MEEESASFRLESVKLAHELQMLYSFRLPPLILLRRHTLGFVEALPGTELDTHGATD